MQSNFHTYTKNFPGLKRFEQNVQILVADGYFMRGRDILINRTPGRLDLMGGNDDYTGGLVFEKTIKEATMVAIQARSDCEIHFLNPAVAALDWDDRIELTLSDLMEGDCIKPIEMVRDWINSNPRRAWCAYLIGDIYYLLDHFPTKIKQGFSLYLESEVPLGKGVSSSAALEVAAMKVMAARYDISVEGVELASWTQWVEIALTQSACGIMDQLAVVMGDEDCFVPMLCQPCQPYPLAKLPENLYVWGIDSDVRHAVSGIEYEAARAATFMGYRYLCAWENLEPVLDKSGALPRWVEPKWNGYLANLSPSCFRSRYENRLPEQQMGSEFIHEFPVHLDPFTPVRPQVNYPVRGATRYAIEENWRVQTFFSLISKPVSQIDTITCKLLGELMYQSHQGYTDCGLGSQYTDMIVDLVRAESANGLFGAKITGGGAGGTVAVLGENSSRAKIAFQRVADQYLQWSKKEPYIFEGSSAGSDAFGVQRIFFS
jgi:L-arabinokinase